MDEPTVDGLASLRTAKSCRVVTRGRRSGHEHVVTVWFALVESCVYAGSRHGVAGDWLQNALAEPRVEVRSGRKAWPGVAHLVSDRAEVDRAVAALVDKYQRHRAITDAWLANPPVLAAIDLSAR